MPNLFKVAWVARGLLYSCFFGRFSMPSYIGRPTFLMNATQIFIGKRVRIFPGLRAECHANGSLTVGDNVAIGQCLHVTCMGHLSIGEGSLITGHVSITDIEHEYQKIEVPVLDQPAIWRKTEIGRNCFIGMGARIQAGTILGDGCIVGANSVVRGVFPDYCVIVGVPGRVVKRFDISSGQWISC